MYETIAILPRALPSCLDTCILVLNIKIFNSANLYLNISIYKQLIMGPTHRLTYLQMDILNHDRQDTGFYRISLTLIFTNGFIILSVKFTPKYFQSHKKSFRN